MFTREFVVYGERDERGTVSTWIILFCSKRKMGRKNWEAMDGKIRVCEWTKREIRSGSILLTLECYLCKV